MRRTLRSGIILLSILSWFSLGARPGAALEREAVTKPSADIELSFVRAGKIAEVLVKEGDWAKPGKLLARQDDTVERWQLLQLKAKAQNRTRIEAAQADLRQKEEDLKKIEAARKKGAATDRELEHARLNVKIAQLSLQLARFEHGQDPARYEELKAELERLHLTSPLEGRMEEISIEPGEAAQPLKPAIRLVKTDPLWIEVMVPLSIAGSLKTGDIGLVRFSGPESLKPASHREGRLSFVDAVSRAGSDTLRVRLEVPNPQGRPAGERVTVNFPLPRVISQK